MTRDRSLNGGQTRPLTTHGRRKLAEIGRGPVPTGKLNAGVVDRLTRGASPLCRIVQRPSPFAKDKGRNVDHLEITAAGRDELAKTSEAS